MFVIDFITAFLLAVAFTVAFAGLVRQRGYRSWRGMPAVVWLLAMGSWLIGILLVAFGALAAHWLPFVISAAALALIAFLLMRAARFRRAVHSETGEPGNDGRPAIALYFCVTLLLFFCAISLRFYILNLS